MLHVGWLMFDKSLFAATDYRQPCLFSLYIERKTVCVHIVLEGWKTQSALVGSKANDRHGHMTTLMLHESFSTFLHGSIKSAWSSQINNKTQYKSHSNSLFPPISPLSMYKDCHSAAQWLLMLCFYKHMPCLESSWASPWHPKGELFSISLACSIA